MTFVILVGPPGSGKGTQAENLVKNYNFYKISSGDLLREEINKKSIKGLEIASYVNEGKLVPDHLISSAVIKSIELNRKNHILLDGYPRNKSQAVLLMEGMDNIDIKVDAIIEFVISDELLITRINNRYLCKRCKVSFSRVIDLDPAKTKFICPKCNFDEFELRKDDSERIFLNRMKNYRDETLDMMNFYKNINVLKMLKIDASLDMRDVRERVQIIISSL